MAGSGQDWPDPRELIMTMLAALHDSGPGALPGPVPEGAAIRVGVDHPGYTHLIEDLAPEQKAALVADLN